MNKRQATWKRELIQERAEALGLVSLGTLREQHGWTIAELAYDLGVPHNYVSNWERHAARPAPHYLARIAQIFRTPVESIFCKPSAPVGRPRKV